MNKRIHKTNRLIILAAAFVMLSAIALPLLLQAQGNLSLRWSNVSSSYGISEGEGYSIAGTSGEVDGSGSLTGDGYQVTGGFWSGVDEPPPWVPPPPPSAQYRLYLPSAVSTD